MTSLRPIKAIFLHNNNFELNSKILIIGAGLTGLTLSYFLRKEGFQPTILEARNRLGGRILTDQKKDLAPIEMGATWLGNQHRRLIGLLNELKIPIFEQKLGNLAFYEPIGSSPPQLVQLPPNNEPSYRVVGGTNTIIRTLVDQLDKDAIFFGETVEQLNFEENYVQVVTNRKIHKVDKVISTLPPYLMVNTIQIHPELTPGVMEIANQTHTWMGESIKVGLRFEKPFWHENKSSGTIFSNVGPIPEMYDHSNFEENRFALKGFSDNRFAVVTKKERLNLILKQLAKYYGEKLEGFLDYEEKIWQNERFTYLEYKEPLFPHQKNGDTNYHLPYFGDRFWIAGSETSPGFPGYMEGAVQSAEFVFKQLMKVID